jgi:hypothetical protein
LNNLKLFPYKWEYPERDTPICMGTVLAALSC